MKVLMVSKACYVATYRKKLEELATLPDMDLTLLVPPYWQTGRNRASLEAGNDQGYQTIVEDPLFNGHFHLHFYRHLPEHLARLRPDLLHIDEEPYDYVTFHALRLGLRFGARALFFSWQNLPRRFPPPFRLLEQHVLRRAHGAIAGSQDAAQVLRDKGFGNPLFVIPQFGVDEDLFTTREGNRAAEPFTPGRPFRIGFSGRLVEEKGLLVLLRAVAGLKGAWELRFLGDGPLRARLEAEARALGLAGQFRFLGSVSSGEVPQHLRELDVLANPSLTWLRGRTQWKEQFGRSLVEAMACGVPVVGSDSGEIPQVIGGAGLVAPEGDAEALRAHLQRLLDEPLLREELARQGRQRVEQHYTQRRIAELTYQAYLRILAEPCPA